MFPLGFLITIILVIFTGVQTKDQKSHPFNLTIIHFNDFHARFEPVNVQVSGRCRKEDGDTCVGGFARLYTLTTRLKQEYENSLILNAGDVFTGSLWFSLFHWNVTSTFFNMIPQDAMTIGNHEFDTKISGLVNYLKSIKYPVIAANIDASREPELQPLFKKSTIVEKGGKKIGIVGYVTRDYTIIADIGKLRILDEIQSLNEEAERLIKEDHVDIVIALSHAGVDVDEQVAKGSRHVSIIVGGHSHTFLYSGTPPCPYDKPKGPYPIVVKSSVDDRKVLVVQAGAYSRYLGLIHLRYDDGNQLVSWTGNPIFMDKHIQQDAEILKAMTPWKEAVDKVGSEVKGYSAVLLDASQGACFLGECNIAAMVLDAMIHEQIGRNTVLDETFGWTYASIGFHNAGGIRSSILEGNITYDDVLEVLPFEDHFSTAEIRGRTIVDILEFSHAEQNYRGPLLFSGIKAVIDFSKPSYSRVSNVRVLCSDCRVPHFEPLNEEKWYRVVFNDFVYNGGDGYDMIKNNSRHYQEGRRDTDIVFDYLKEINPIFQAMPNNFITLHMNKLMMQRKYEPVYVNVK